MLMKHLRVCIKTFGSNFLGYSGRKNRKWRLLETDKAKMFFKFLTLAAVFLICQGAIPDRLYYRRVPLRFIFNNQGMRRPNIWNYQIVNGRPVISGFPNANSYVAFGLNPQTGQIEQTQIITQTRPRGPFLNMIQNMLNVAGQLFGQLTGAFGNAVGGALQTVGKFNQDVQDLTNPVISVTGISHPPSDPKEPIQEPSQPVTEGPARPPVVPSIETLSTPSIEIVPEQAKSDFQTAIVTLNQAIKSFQSFRTNVQVNFQDYFESEEGEKALNKINENINWGVNKLQDLRESAITEPINVLQSGQNAANIAFDNIENALVSVAGIQGRDFIEPIRSELNTFFNQALAAFEESANPVNTAVEATPAK